MTELLYGVYPSSFKQLCKLRTYAMNADKIGMVCPLKNELVRNASLLSQSFTSCRNCTLSQQLFYFVDTGSSQFLCIGNTYAFNVYNFVSHNNSFLMFSTTWQKKPYICNPTPSQSVRKLAVYRFTKTASRLTAIFLPRCSVNYLRVQRYKLKLKYGALWCKMGQLLRFF